VKSKEATPIASKNPSSARKNPELRSVWQTSFALFIGLFLALLLLKWGNPVILSEQVQAPSEFAEWLVQAWPLNWAYPVLFCIGLVALPGMKSNSAFKKWPVILMFVWFVWQFLAASQSIDPKLSRPALMHFGAAVVCFGIGAFCLPQLRSWKWIQVLLLVALLLVIKSGFQQHFGGLAEARRYFQIYVLPNLTEAPPPELIKKMSSERIFGTLFYPNTLAGAFLLFLPLALFSVYQFTSMMSRPSRIFLVLLFSGISAACFLWTGSKSGWLIALVMACVCLNRLSIAPRIKWVVVTVLLCGGLAGFFVRYATFFQKGATSVTARFDYWKAAATNFKEHPWLGSGPATFSRPYARIKSPEAEMTRLAHNDYIEQATDSGFVGFLSYSAFVLASVVCLYRKREEGFNLEFFIWLGCLGMALQSFTEFPLYIPALGWPTFLFLGFLWARQTEAPGKPSTAVAGLA
jgi:hypothetical protein